ncbi:MAG: thioredoxin family protein [Pseudomonadales bacterium]
MPTVKLTTQKFKEDIFDYTAEKEWNYKGDKPAIIDFYADWCVTCIEMEHFTFTDPRVKKALSKTLLIQADVTKNNDDDRALLKTFNLIGPPAILFFDPAHQQGTTGRVIGYLNADEFLAEINNAI